MLLLKAVLLSSHRSQSEELHSSSEKDGPPHLPAPVYTILLSGSIILFYL